MNGNIEKIQNECLEVHEETSNCYTLVVSKNNGNKIVNHLKECGAELHFNYGENIIIKVLF